MTTNDVPSTRVPEVPKGVPIANTKVMERILNCERLLVRWLNFSVLTYLTFKQAKLKVAPSCLMIIKGRKSGNWIETPISYYRDGEKIIVLASFGGSPTHPLWFLNLQANPDCRIHTRWRTRDVRARVATGAERQRLWAHCVAQYPGYDDYARKAAPREIPVVVFEKR